MQKRTFSLSVTLLKKLDVLCDCFYLDKSTFIRMAIYHGVENIKNGYYPYRNMKIKKLEKKKYNITLPEETWEELENVKNKITWMPDDVTPDIKMNVVQNIPDGELIEMFIRMEIKGMYKYVSNYLTDDEVDDLELFEKMENIKVTVELPRIFYDKIQDTASKTGLKEIKIGKYLLTSALFKECCQSQLTAIDTDADLIRYIDMLGFNRYKAITLLKTLAESNKILFLNDANEDS